MEREAVTEAARLLQASQRTVIITGAGCSVDAGLPDFRSKSGWWRQIDPLTVATVEALESRYELFHEFYTHRIEALKGVQPHAGHDVIRSWETNGLLQLVATQNVDGLHQLAGNRQVEELHGSLRRYRCHDCRTAEEQADFASKAACRQCGGRLRPGVVLFGESLPERAWERSLEAIRAAELVLVIGTSLQVYPVNQLPFLTKGATILLNRDKTGEEHRFDIVIQGTAVEALQAIEAARIALPD